MYSQCYTQKKTKQNKTPNSVQHISYNVILYTFKAKIQENLLKYKLKKS